MYIGVLPTPQSTAIFDNLTTFAQHQLTQHHNRFASQSSAKPSTILNIYHDYAATKILHNHTLLVIDILKRDKVSQTLHAILDKYYSRFPSAP